MYKTYWLYENKFLQDLSYLAENNIHDNIILSTQINHNWVVLSKNNDLFIDWYGFRFNEETKRRNWFLLSPESKTKLDKFAKFTIRFYLDTTDENLPDVLWTFDKKYDEDKQMFYVDFKHCSIIVESSNEFLLNIDKRKHYSNNSFLHLLFHENDIDNLFSLISKKYYEKNVEEFNLLKNQLIENINNNSLYLVND